MSLHDESPAELHDHQPLRIHSLASYTFTPGADITCEVGDQITFTARYTVASTTQQNPFTEDGPWTGSGTQTALYAGQYTVYLPGLASRPIQADERDTHARRGHGIPPAAPSGSTGTINVGSITKTAIHHHHHD